MAPGAILHSATPDLKKVDDMNDRLLLTPEVVDALSDNRPVVALESSIVAQGLPEPDNLIVGRAMQDAVRDQGAVPAMTAVLGGRLRVGLSDADMARLANAPDGRKCGGRDLGAVLALGLPGATTVSATVAIAAAAGIGGVHCVWKRGCSNHRNDFFSVFLKCFETFNKKPYSPIRFPSQHFHVNHFL